jgi:hypothetical protein
MPDGVVTTEYPHDRLSRLADLMTAALAAAPGTGDVRAVVMLSDREDRCVHPHNYPDPIDAGNALLFIDSAVHLMALGRALGVRVEVSVNGEKVGVAP